MPDCLGNTAAAADAELASSGGQVINLTTGANETEAAARAVSMLTQTASEDPSYLRSPTTATAAASGSKEVDGRGTEGEQDVAKEVEGGEGLSSKETLKQGKAEFIENLGDMTPGALISSFRRAQEERVALYKRFNG